MDTSFASPKNTERMHAGPESVVRFNDQSRPGVRRSALDERATFTIGST